MAKGKRKTKKAIKEKQQEQQFYRVVAISTGILLVLLFMLYSNS